MFDHVMLLAPGGHTVYFGEIGTHALTISEYYFARYGAVMSVEDNPAEFIKSTVTGKGAYIKNWPQIWNSSPEKKALHEKIHAINSTLSVLTTGSSVSTDSPRVVGEYALPLSAQIVILTQRHWRAVWRNGHYNFSRLAKCLFFEMFVSFTFFHISNSSSGLQNHMLGILLSSWVVPTIAADVQAVWYDKWSIFEARERNGIYNYKALVSALILVEIPYNLVLFTLIFLVSYWTFGFASAPSIAGFIYFMYLLFSLFGLGATYLMAACLSNPTMAGYAMSLLWVILLMFSGAANPRSALNDFYRPWLYWADPLAYFFESTVSTVLHGVDVNCASDELAIFDPPLTGQSCQEYLARYLESNPGYLANQSATRECVYCPYSTGDDFAETLHFFFANRWRDWAVFLGFSILVFVVTWVSRVMEKG